MSIAVDALFTTALVLQELWVDAKVNLDTAKRKIAFEVLYEKGKLPCPVCGVNGQGIHDCVTRIWWHLAFFQFKVWLHSEVPRVDCSACCKMTQAEVARLRRGSGFTLLFGALALSLYQTLSVAQAAAQLRGASKRLWRRIEHGVNIARSHDVMTGVQVVDIDETSINKKGQNCITAQAWRLKQALREVCRGAVAANCTAKTEQDSLGWISWARHCRLVPFKRLVNTLKKRLPDVVHGMLDGRSNAYVKVMSGLLLQTKLAARGFRTVTNVIAIAIANLLMVKLKHLPVNPLHAAVPREFGVMPPAA